MYRYYKGCAAACAFALAANAADALVVGSFTGSYDEATGAEAAGDYDNIGGTLDVGEFILVEGANTFQGAVSTPSDSGDVFNITLQENFFLVGASLTFAENATAFNPYFGFPSPAWGLFESDTTPTIFNIAIPDTNGAFSPLNFTASFAERGQGTYNMVLANGVFGMNDASSVDYTMVFTTEFRAPPPPPPPPPAVPLPAGAVLMLSALGGVAAMRRLKRSAV